MRSNSPLFSALLVVAGCLMGNRLSAQPSGFPPSALPPTRAALLQKHDKNGDGRLDDTEREAMRAARSAEKLQPGGGGRGMGFQFPPEVVKKYDADGDGKLDDKENEAAREGIRRRWEQVTKDYDKNGNGRLDEDELDAVRGDIDSGKIEGLPRSFGRRGPWGGQRRPVNPREGIIRNADADKDGRLSEAELKVAREALDRLGTSENPRKQEAR